MGSKAKSLKISHDLAEASILRAKFMGHPSWAGYVKALIRQDIVRGGSRDQAHTDEMAGGFKDMTLCRQDKYDQLLLKSIRKNISPPPAE